MSSADRVPGVSTSFTATSDISANAPNNRCLLAGLVLPGSLAKPGSPFLCQSEAQVDSQTGGAMAHASRLYRAALAQRPDAEYWIWPQQDPAGTKATRTLTFAPAPAYDPTNGWITGTGAGAPQGATCTLDVAGQITVFAVNANDTWSTIAQSALTALQTISDLVVTPTITTKLVANDTVTLTDVHGADMGNDLPVRISFDNPSCGIGVITGTLTLATTATGDGNISITDGIQTASIHVTSGDTVATDTPLLRNAINANLPVVAAITVASPGLITMYHLGDRWVRRFTVADAATGMTAVLAQGTPGTGIPVFTGAGGPLSILSGDQGYKAWGMPFADTTTLGAMVTHIVAQDAEFIEKGQMLFTAITTALPSSPLPAATTPAMTTTELTVVGHYQGATVRAGEIAARLAAEVAAETDYGRNYNGLLLLGSEEMPLAVPHRADRSGRPAWNAAIAQGYAPIAVNSGNQAYVVDSTTTFASGSDRTAGLTKWSGALIPIFFRADLRTQLAATFFPPGNGKSLKQHGVPRTNRAVTVTGVRSEIIALIEDWDAADLFDYSPDINAAIMVKVFQTPQTGISVQMPFRTVRDLDKMRIAGYPA